ncbi:hypothetical protein [Arthrobacter agilis]|uniref:hypothetical protein n=1 Tax=Arthrobacter agilis TaxID=37921 RepID=UPI00278AFABD|nr:hypothetical protein [Arthrobacter agilis]MDQ0735151.1 hypothetical protein [Arthrobacter agilis]
MAWFNADDKMHSHPKVRAAGLEATGLWLVCGTYCTDYLTDGVVPGWHVQSWPKGRQLAQRLITAGLWTAEGDQYRFLSWTEYQRTKEQVENEKRKARERKRKWLDGQEKDGEER